MKFVTMPTTECEGALIAHALRLPDLFLAKGYRLGPEQLAGLQAAGVEHVVVAKLDLGDVAEDQAARRAGRNLVGPGTDVREADRGRVNLCALTHGLVTFDVAAVDTLNRIDESITIATLPLHDVVAPGQLVATIKVNPYAVKEHSVSAWEAAARPIGIAPFRPLRTSLIQTSSTAIKEGVHEKTTSVTMDRLRGVGCALVANLRTTHGREAVSAAIRARVDARDDLVLVCGASSVADRSDTVPAAIEDAGGRIEHFGMPVDPGNLLLLGFVDDVPVIGMAACARTKQLNGFDFVLRRVAAGLPVGHDEIMGMGVGGLLRRVFPS